MLEIKLALDIIRTSALGCVDGILNGCEIGVLDGVSLGIFQVDIG